MKRIRKTIVDFENKLIIPDTQKEDISESANELDSYNDNITSSYVASNNLNFLNKNREASVLFSTKRSFKNESNLDDISTSKNIEKEKLRKFFPSLATYNSNPNINYNENEESYNLIYNRENSIINRDLNVYRAIDYNYDDYNSDYKVDLDNKINEDMEDQINKGVLINNLNFNSNINQAAYKSESLVFDNNFYNEKNAENVSDKKNKELKNGKATKADSDQQNAYNNNNTSLISERRSSVLNIFSKFKTGFAKLLFNKGESSKELVPKNLVFNFGADLSDTDKEGRNIIHRAFLQNNLELIENFLNVGKITDKKLLDIEDKYGNTPIILACKLPMKESENFTRKKLIQTLIRYDVNLNQTEKINLWNASHWLCQNQDYESLIVFMRNGGAYFTPDLEGNFPIDIAGKLNNEKIVTKLIFVLLSQLKKIGYKEDFIENIIDDEIKKYENKLKNNLFELLDEYNNFNFYSKKAKITRRKNMQEKREKEHDIGLSEFMKKRLIKQNNYDNNDDNNIYNNIINYDDSNEENYEDNENALKVLNFTDDEAEFTIGFTGFNLTLVCIFIKILINHCLYWGCFYKLNNEYVINKLLDLGANPIVSR